MNDAFQRPMPILQESMGLQTGSDSYPNGAMSSVDETQRRAFGIQNNGNFSLLAGPSGYNGGPRTNLQSPGIDLSNPVIARLWEENTRLRIENSIYKDQIKDFQAPVNLDKAQPSFIYLPPPSGEERLRLELDKLPPLPVRDRKDSRYKHVKHWVRKDFDKKDTSKWTFITDINGESVEQDALDAIWDSASKCFVQVHYLFLSAPTWTGMPSIVVEYFQRFMYARHDMLSFCENHWKVDLIAVNRYFEWHRRAKNQARCPILGAYLRSLGAAPDVNAAEPRKKRKVQDDGSNSRRDANTSSTPGAHKAASKKTPPSRRSRPANKKNKQEHKAPIDKPSPMPLTDNRLDADEPTNEETEPEMHASAPM